MGQQALAVLHRIGFNMQYWTLPIIWVGTFLEQPGLFKAD